MGKLNLPDGKRIAGNFGVDFDRTKSLARCL
jgi:hypothetical protein